jgi:hypothetical protein
VVQKSTKTLADLYLADETAWLDAMAELIRANRADELDYEHLAEYLEDMAIRDRREVKSRLAILMAHILKWNYQKEKRTSSWRGTITVQRQELADLTERGVLRNHAEQILAKAYADAVEQAASETGLPVETFPGECPWTFESVLSSSVLDS